MVRRSRVMLAAASFMASCAAFVGCSSSEPPPAAPGVRWEAKPDVASALGISHWMVSGDDESAELSGVRQQGGKDVVVVHGVLGRGDDRLLIDVDLPKRWRLEAKRGEVPVLSGAMPRKVGIALAGSALDLADRMRSSGAAQAPGQVLAPTSDGVRPQNSLVSTGSTCLVGGTQQLLSQGATYTGSAVPYQGVQLLNGLPASCTKGTAVNPYAPSCAQSGQTFTQNACPGWSGDPTTSAAIDLLGKVLDAVLNQDDDEDGAEDSDGGAAQCKDEDKITYYRDADGDGVGGTETKRDCKSPGDGWVTKSGDCNDNDKNVFPGQTAFFTMPYQKDGVSSYDYDCSAKEEQQNPPRTAAGTCALSEDKKSCTGEGFVASRTRTGAVDSLCGAVRFQACKLVRGTCEATLTDATSTPCH